MTHPIDPHARTAVQDDNTDDRATTADGGNAACLELSRGVRAVIVRRAKAIGLSDVAYFHEIIAGRAPRITRLEASREATA
jgi:hypothetical protein